MYDKILVPTDGSDTAAVGLAEAIKLARSQHGRIRLVHVVNELVVVSGELSGTTFGDVVELLRGNGEADKQKRNRAQAGFDNFHGDLKNLQGL